ncbi:D-tagatose-bisphosphate aldolase, class II, non-catalytic subunit [Azospirillum sp. ST 5-10]|uniref:D-tagatose-bisphosphate aldolase, class II, non-catalytic subunit n=1 Tax=unclassified Azospirillum TaxID=2630922 RepID=UPI003F49C368
MTANPLETLSASRRSHPSGRRGMPSVCSAHPLVIEAAMRHAARRGCPVLIEATCNQVNQDGGYTGMTPKGFRDFVAAVAARVGFPVDRVILGGDHLGPNPWKTLPADEAMAKAETMIGAFAEAGFTKLHLDTSMGCAGEPVALGDVVTAERAARLAAVAEAATANAAVKPVYVIGTEVPIPGGAMEDIAALDVTRPDAARETVRRHREAFAAAGAAAAFERVIAAVVQPGVEFGNHNVVAYDPGRTAALSAVLDELPGFVFEAHSTDYQTPAALRALVHDGFAILKVGPALTFALREAVYGLDQIAEVLFPGRRAETLRETVERVMLARPGDWAKYYPGTADEQRVQRHFSYSDRIRYYWPQPEVARAVDTLFALLDGAAVPETLVSQYLRACYAGVRSGAVTPTAHELAIGMVDIVLEDYFSACR